MHFSKVLAAAALALLIALPAMANDTLVTLGAGGLVPLKSSQIVMESEDLQISAHQITVRYVFHNESDHDIDATVAFPLPALDGGTLYGSPIELPSPSLVNFVGFKATIAGEPVVPKVQVRAFTLKPDRDITARIRKLGLPISVVDHTRIDAAVRKLPPNQLEELKTDELIIPNETLDASGKVVKTEYWPAWQMRVEYYWTQRFPANENVTVVHTYRPVVGGSYIVADDDGARSVKPYCGGVDALNQIKKVKEKLPAKQDDIALWERRIQYILTTGNNWSGPIQHFRLSVLTDRPDDIVLTCTPDLRRVAPTRYELSRSSFHPDGELDLLILEANKAQDKKLALSGIAGLPILLESSCGAAAH
jgi:hypothetical protein